MSNISPLPLPTVVVKNELMDFIQPVYTINAPSSLKSFNAQDITTFSNSYVNATLNLNSAEFVVDPFIIHEQPITITVNGSSSLNQNIFLDGCYAFRSNALYKAVNTVELKIGSTSNTTNVGDVMTACERFNNYTFDKFINSFGLSYLDQSQSYNDLLGAPRNPLATYSSGLDIIEPRASYSHVITNSKTSATIQATLRMAVPISPLIDKIRRDGQPITGLSHLNNISFNITFYPNMANRLLSFADVRPSGDTLTITSMTVQLGSPVFNFVQLKSRNERIPRVLSYPLVSQERYVYSLPAIPYETTRTYTVSSFNLTRVPQSMLLYVRASNNTLLNSVNGVFLPDTFAKLNNLSLQYDGQTLFGQSQRENYYTMSVSNGLSDTWTQFCGDKVVKSANNGTYLYPVGSVIKLEFGKDISLFPDTVVGSMNETAINLSVDITNISPYSACASAGGLELYMVMLYSDCIQLHDTNLATISNIPVSMGDILNMKNSEHVHRVVLRNADITGAGVLSSINNFLKNPKLLGVVKTLKDMSSSPLAKEVRRTAKEYLRNRGHENILNVAETLGMGRRKMRGSAMSGGALADMEEIGASLYED